MAGGRWSNPGMAGGCREVAGADAEFAAPGLPDAREIPAEPGKTNSNTPFGGEGRGIFP